MSTGVLKVTEMLAAVANIEGWGKRTMEQSGKINEHFFVFQSGKSIFNLIAKNKKTKTKPDRD